MVATPCHRSAQRPMAMKTGWQASKQEDGPPDAAASRIVHRKVTELMSPGGSRDASKARSMALDLVDRVLFVGVLRSMNAAAGQGFIRCPETQALFSRDLPVAQSECDGVPVGEQVSFRLRMLRGVPTVYAVAWPPRQGPSGGPEASWPSAEGLSGMAAVLAHDNGPTAASRSEAALAWRQSREAGGRTGMDSLLAHADGPGRSACDWRPSTEADDRSGMAAVLAHKSDPETYPTPQVRQGTFVGWKSN
mmetsp:Transcript_40401/g.128416  ORF Transcript_40401/g.128416 Transcript_40401/m.128416 type:complete len:249 (+) Transcript_40401:61-807(+)